MKTPLLPPLRTSDPQTVFKEVCDIAADMYADFDLSALNRVFEDVTRLFEGRYPGYRACNTEYHDLRHTTDVFLAMARVLHGIQLGGQVLSEKAATLGLISSLMHDTGYIQADEDCNGTGAKYTLVHVDRSIRFMERYFLENGYSGKDSKICGTLIKSTDLNVKFEDVAFESSEYELIGKAHLAADLLGQMADRLYLEKLLFLYREFSEGHVMGYESELELLEKTFRFYDAVSQRLSREFGDMDGYLRNHFRARLGEDENVYMDKIEKNMEYLRFLIDNHRGDYRDKLKRGELVKRLEAEEVKGTEAFSGVKRGRVSVKGI